MNHVEELKKISAEMRPILERQLDDAELLVPLRERASKIGLDWGRIKALLKAQIQDERSEAGGSEHVDKVVKGADAVIAYADTLGITPKMNNNNLSSEGRAPEPATLTAVNLPCALATRRGEPSPESPNTACPPSLPDKPSSVAGTAPNNVGAGTPAALEPASPPVSDAAGTIFDTPADGSIPEFLRRYPAVAPAGPN